MFAATAPSLSPAELAVSLTGVGQHGTTKLDWRLQTGRRQVWSSTLLGVFFPSGGSRDRRIDIDALDAHLPKSRTPVPHREPAGILPVQVEDGLAGRAVRRDHFDLPRVQPEWR